MALDEAKILGLVWFQSIVDLVRQGVLLFALIFARVTLAVVAMYLEYLDTSATGDYRYI